MAELVGALTANIYMLLIIAVFAARLRRRPDVGRRIGLASALVLIPLIYLFAVGLQAEQRGIYFIWLGLMFAFALFELIVDGIRRIDFRHTRWAVIFYVMFFFAATGGMIGVASRAGQVWTVVTCIVFLAMAALSFVQRRATGE